MLTYKEALSKAKAVKSKINKCSEFKGAYAFFYDDGSDTDGGDSPVVIVKSSGAALNFVSYAVKHGHEFVKTFDVE